MFDKIDMAIKVGAFFQKTYKEIDPLFQSTQFYGHYDFQPQDLAPIFSVEQEQHSKVGFLVINLGLNAGNNQVFCAEIDLNGAVLRGKMGSRCIRKGRFWYPLQGCSPLWVAPLRPESTPQLGLGQLLNLVYE